MDMRLALLRHWTLYESLLYASYVAVRMHTYNDAGRNKMEDLLVNMGVPLAQSKHSYSAHAACVAVLLALVGTFRSRTLFLINNAAQSRHGATRLTAKAANIRRHAGRIAVNAVGKQRKRCSNGSASQSKGQLVLPPSHNTALHPVRRSAGNMQPRYQRSLQTKLQENAPMYGLSEVTFRSFVLKRGWSRVGSELTAADTVAAVTALLEAAGRPDDPDNTHTQKFWCAADGRPALTTPLRPASAFPDIHLSQTSVSAVARRTNVLLCSCAAAIRQSICHRCEPRHMQQPRP